MKIYTEVVINPASSGFGMYQTDFYHFNSMDSWAFKGDLLHAIRDNSDRLLKIEDALTDPEFLEQGVEDIRGRIINQPAEIYARLDRGWLNYVGIAETDVEESFFDAKEVNV